jgi:hypothetical protein
MHSSIHWDWKRGPSKENLEKALKPFGLHLYSDPLFEGSDGFGFIISNAPLTPEELEVLSEDS